jgi:hypothetical protein
VWHHSAPSESSAWPLPVPTKATSCDVEFPVEGVVIVSVCALLFLWGINFIASAVVIGSIWWCLSLSVGWVSSIRSECV